MSNVHLLGCFAACLLAGLPVPAQEVQLMSGEVLAGAVARVEGHLARVQLANGGVRQMDVRHIDCSRAADGTVHWHAASLVAGPIGAEARSQLDRLRKGEALAVPDLHRLTESCSRALFDELVAMLQAKDPAARLQAVRALASAATPETVAAALSAALAQPDAAMLREVATALMAGPALGALAAGDGVAQVEKGLSSKDRTVRRACAWVATKLGSQTAPAVLATFLGDPDHHVRESAAVCLAERGDDAGAKVLLTMVKRERSPAMVANRAADEATRHLVERAARRERMQCCSLLGSLRYAAALPTMKALAAGNDVELAHAAAKAVARIEGSAPAPR